MDYQGHGWFCSLDSFFLVVVKPKHEAPAQRATYIVRDYSQAMHAVINSMYDFNKLVDEVDAAVVNGTLKLVDGETLLKRVPFGCVRAPITDRRHCFQCLLFCPLNNDSAP